jgi:hypothetical protein
VSEGRSLRSLRAASEAEQHGELGVMQSACWRFAHSFEVRAPAIRNIKMKVRHGLRHGASLSYRI